MIVNRPKKKKTIERYNVFYIIMSLLFLTIILKLVYLQVYKHDDYKEQADIGSTRFVSEKAPRGKIYDSEGDILATNIQTYSLTYTKPSSDNNNFYETMEKIFEILDENKELFKDDLALNVDKSGKFSFKFTTDDVDTKKAIEIRFKRDRGLNEDIEKRLFKDVETDLTDAQIETVNTELLKISAEDTFYEMVKLYDLQDLILIEPVQEAEETLESYQLRLKEYNIKLDSYEDRTGKEITKELQDSGYTLEKIRKYLVVKDSINMQSFKGYRSVTIASNISKDTAFIIYQKLNDLPGIDVTIEPIRFYPYKTLASSILGYMSSIDSSKEENYELRGYDVSSDLIGVAGIESALESQLKGVKGGTTVKVNSKGRITEELFKLESYPGNNVYLTIDKDVQYAAEQSFKDTAEYLRTSGIAPNATRGAVVAIEVKTGRVLAMVSYPDYDPNIFSIPGMLTDEVSEQYFNPDIEKFAKEYMNKTGATGNINDLFPVNEETGKREDGIDVYPKNFFNYASQGSLPPGSTFKPLTSVAALMEGVVTSNEVLMDYSGRWVRDELGIDLENFEGRANGATNLRYALQMSSNYFFYEMGYRLYSKNGGNIESLDTLAKYAWQFGMGADPSLEDYNNIISTGTGIQIEENFGQTYNFKSWRNKIAERPMHEIVTALKAGTYYYYSFIPLNIEDNESDIDKLKESKTALKTYMKETLSKVGTDEEVTDSTEYSKSLKPYIKNIMDVSEEYKKNVVSSSQRRTVDLDEEAGVIADALSYYILDNLGAEIITPGQIISAAIGQGMSSYTPLQIANYVATLANGGTRYKLTLVDKITSPTGEVIKEYEPEILNQIDIPKEYINAIKEGMYAVNTYPGNGVAYQSFGNFPIKVAGKTGTADFSTDDQYVIQGRLAYGNYITFAPLDDPEIAIFSTVYDGRRGSEGATIHKAIYEAYFKDRLLEMDSNYGAKSESFRKYVIESPLKENKNDSLKLGDNTKPDNNKTLDDNKTVEDITN